MGALGVIVKLLIAYQVGLTAKENVERHDYYGQAREYADAVGKPLLAVGLQHGFWQPPNGDITIDINPDVESIEGGIMADVRDIPFPDKYFGACYCPHVLEHLESAEDVQRAVDECVRVSNMAVFLCPSPYSITGNFFCPAHHLRLWFDPELNRIRVTGNEFRTGLGIPSAGQYEQSGRITQSLVALNPPNVVEIRKGIVIQSDSAVLL